MSGTAFDTPPTEGEEEAFVARAEVRTSTDTFIVSQKASTVLRYAREALTAGAEVKRPFFVELNIEAGKAYIAANDIKSITSV